MKKILSVIMVLSMLFTMSACSQKESLPPSSSSCSNNTPTTSVKSSDSISSGILPYDGVFPQHEAYGTGFGAMPGRVVWSYNPDSVDWDGNSYWWKLDHFNEKVIQRMVRNGIANLGGTNNISESWNVLFQYNNETRGKSGGYLPGEKIAIKANMNGAGMNGSTENEKSNYCYTNPVLLKTLLVSLVDDAGIAPSNITVYDTTRVFPDYMMKLCSSGILKGVQFCYLDLTGSNAAKADHNAPLVWSEKINGDQCYLPTCVTEAEYLINLATMKGHDYGITLCAKNHFASFMNSYQLRAPQQAGLHSYLTQNKMGIYNPLVDLMGNYQLGKKTFLYLQDAIISPAGNTYYVTEDNSRWQMEPFNNDYTSSIMFSQDPVAINSVAADFLINEPTVTNRNSALKNNSTVENYLHEVKPFIFTTPA